MDVLTGWFPRGIRPVHAGAYLVRDFSGDVVPSMMLWDGRRWRYLNGICARARTFGHLGIEWQGLAFDPTRAVEFSDVWTGEPGMWVPAR